MVTIIRMRVVMDTAGFIVDNMRTNYKHKRERKKPVLVVMPELFCEQEANTCGKNQHRNKAVMMAPVAMP
jgi:hypothetical protein